MGCESYLIQLLLGDLKDAGGAPVVLACGGQIDEDTGCHQLDESGGYVADGVLGQPARKIGNLAGGVLYHKVGWRILGYWTGGGVLQDDSGYPELPPWGIHHNT